MTQVRGSLRVVGAANAVSLTVASTDVNSLLKAFAADPNATLFLAVSGLTVEQIALSLRSLDARRAQLRGTSFSTTLCTGEGRDEVWSEVRLDHQDGGALMLTLSDVTDLVAVDLATTAANIAEAPGSGSPSLDDIIPELETGMVLLQPDVPFGRLNNAAKALLGADTLRTARRQLDLLAGDIFASPVTRIAVRESGDGSVLTLAITANPVELGGRQMSLVTITDISGHVPVEDVQSDLTATINHEMRTPLASLIGSLDLLSAELADADERSGKLLDMSRRNAGRLAALVEDLMLVHEADGGSLSVDLDRVEVADAVKEARDTNAGFASLNDVSLSLECDLGGEAISADPRRLQQVLSNLISNAVKYSGDARRVRLSARRRGENIEISVRDHGLGIPQADLPHIFDRYYRVDAANHRRVHGTGLGLAITRDLVDRMGGEISVLSSTGDLPGSEFTLSFPICAAPRLSIDPR